MRRRKWLSTWKRLNRSPAKKKGSQDGIQTVLPRNTLTPSPRRDSRDKSPVGDAYLAACSGVRSQRVTGGSTALSSLPLGLAAWAKWKQKWTKGRRPSGPLGA